jgi:threonine dehydrogenase-like Zn-dependent dehydrogenase
VGEGGSVSLDVSPDMLRRQITIVASWTFSTVGQAECARFVAERKVDVDHLFTHRWSLDEAVQAYRLFDTQSTGKGVFLM